MTTTTSDTALPFTEAQLQWLRENLVIEVADTYGTNNSTWIRLAFKGDSNAFSEDRIYIPSDPQ